MPPNACIILRFYDHAESRRGPEIVRGGVIMVHV